MCLILDHYMDKQALDSANFYLDKLNKECRVQNVFVIVGKVENGDAFPCGSRSGQ